MCNQVNNYFNYITQSEDKHTQCAQITLTHITQKRRLVVRAQADSFDVDRKLIDVCAGGVRFFLLAIVRCVRKFITFFD